MPSLVQIARTLPWQRMGGMETHAWELARALAGRGWKIDILTTAFDGAERTEEREGIRVHYLAHLPRGHEAQPDWRWWGRFARRVAQYAVDHELHPDVAHSESTYGHEWFRRLRRKHPKTVRVFTLHGTALQTYRETGRPQVLARHGTLHPRAIGQWAYMARRRSVESRSMLPLADRIVAVSPALASHVRDDYRIDAARIEVIPNGISVPDPSPSRAAARRRLDLPADDIVVLYVGRLEPSKRVERLLEHGRRHPDRWIVIAGTGSLAPTLERIRDGLPRPDRARLLGPVSEATKADLLAAADVFALPSEAEGQPIVLLEALAAGLPVYARRPWLPDVLKPLAATGDDVEAGIEAARSKADRVRKASADIRRDYGWDQVAQRYEALFEAPRAATTKRT